MKYIATFLFAAGILLFFQQCTKEKTPQELNCTSDCADTIKFSTQIMPIISKQCMTCHDAGGTASPVINDYGTVSGNASNILSSLKNEAGFQLMPQGGPALNDSIIEHFCCWIKQGKANN